VQFDLLPNGRRVVWIGNEKLQIALANGGGHIAALRTPGMSEQANPYWQPPWNSIEPEAATPSVIDQEYGGAPEGRLLASILGHSVALDLYGPPSVEETLAGAVTHGQVGVQPWTWTMVGTSLVGDCHDWFAQLQFSRRIHVEGTGVSIKETVKNLCARERAIGWQQHVSLGPPFCEEGFWSDSNCDLGVTHPESFGEGASLIPGRETHWPLAPRRDGGTCNYRQPFEARATANDFSGYRISPAEEFGQFVAGNTRLGYALCYLWPRRFFPWLGVWDERHARGIDPWKKRTAVRAFEFGVSPYPQSWRDRLQHPYLFETPTYLMLPGGGSHSVCYWLGVFTQVMKSATLRVSPSAASLVRNGHEIGRIELSGDCASSLRPEMEKA
jgi:hypothetical protein